MQDGHRQSFFAPSGAYIAVVSDDAARQFDARTGKPRAQLRHDARVGDLHCAGRQVDEEQERTLLAEIAMIVTPETLLA